VYSYNINYDALKTSAGTLYNTFASKEKLTIECSHWRNPILPEIATTFSISSFDFSATPVLIDAADPFSVVPGGGTYAASPIADQAIKYIVSAPAGAKAPIQSLSTYTISITSPVPLEVASPAAGAPAVACYLEVEFPRELSAAAGARSYTGNDLLATSGTSSPVTPVLEDFSGPRALVVFKGCANTALHGKSKVSQVLGFVMPNIKNPYAEQATSAFSIKIFASYDVATKTGSQEIAATTTFAIPASAYGSGALADIEVSAGSRVVQEATTHAFKFTIENEIPGTTAAGGATDIQSGVHIHLPSSFREGTVGTAAVAGASVTGTPTAAVDTTALYDPRC
jgi:hypothetical protein